jgi:hypothetical protein
MTTSEIDRLSRILTDMRVESAAQFARLDERLNAVPDLAKRVAVLEQFCQRTGRFTWADVFKVVAAIAAIVAIYTSLVGTH